LIEEVFVVLTTPLTRKATTAIRSSDATPIVTIISTSVKPGCAGSRLGALGSFSDGSAGSFMASPSGP
jgi:hypothetical protein